MTKLILFLSLAGLVSVGCQSADVQVTKEQEQQFRNPPKDIPPDVAAKMQKSMKEAFEKAKEVRKQNGN